MSQETDLEFYIKNNKNFVCVIGRNTANGPNFMLPFTDTHRDDLNPKIFAPTMAAPQTGAYLALRHLVFLDPCAFDSKRLD